VLSVLLRSQPGVISDNPPKTTINLINFSVDQDHGGFGLQTPSETTLACKLFAAQVF
jgi:hypothetical protein